MSSPYVGKVVDLVDPYRTIDSTRQGGNKVPLPAGLRMWLDSHPGRWAMTAENGLGISTDIMERHGYQTARRDAGRYHYARVPHPDGEPIHLALRRNRTNSIVLPALERDPFNWTPAELADAVQCARDNLFPVADRKVA